MPRRTTPAPETEPLPEPETVPETGPVPEEVPAAEPGTPGFFGWVRRLGLTRGPGWLGGVCAGIAARLGVDPILVRGVVVVVAILGGPALLLYALAWFLLPDERGVIHAQELGRGIVSRAIPGIVGVFLLSFIPVAQGFWMAGAFYWGDPGWAGVILRIFWTALILAVVIVAVVVLARRASHVTSVPATTDDQPDSIPNFPEAHAAAAFAASETTVANSTVANPTVAKPGEPTPPPADASADELAAWKRGQDEWQRQRKVWVSEQRRTEQERRRVAYAAELAVSREQARVRRLTRPRESAGIVALATGVALIGAALAAAWAQGAAPTRGTEWVVGAATLTGILGLGIVVVGLIRRRSGVLSFFGILSLILLAVALVVPTDRQVLPPATNYSLDRSVDGRYAQLLGSTWIHVMDREAGEVAPVIDLWQLTGTVQVDLDEGASVRVELTTDSASQSVYVHESLPEEAGRDATYVVRDGKLVATIGGGDVDLVLRVWIGSGVSLMVSAASALDQPIPLDPEPDSRYEWPEPTPIPTPSPTVTEGATP